MVLAMKSLGTRQWGISDAVVCSLDFGAGGYVGILPVCRCKLASMILVVF